MATPTTGHAGGPTITLEGAYTPSDVWVSAASGLHMVCGFPADFTIRDGDGNVIKDSKAERLFDNREFREQCLRHVENQVLEGLLASFSRALADPADQMTHLYEIRDALSRHFGGDREAKQELGLTRAKWSDLGRIANKEPIEESRHRGDHPVRRPVTEEERTRVIDFSRSMIRAYLNYLDRTLPP